MNELRFELPLKLAVWVKQGSEWKPGRICGKKGDIREIRYFPKTDIGHVDNNSNCAETIIVSKFEVLEYTRFITLANQSIEVFSMCVEANIWIRTYGLQAQRDIVARTGFLTNSIAGIPGSFEAKCVVDILGRGSGCI